MKSTDPDVVTKEITDLLGALFCCASCFDLWLRDTLLSLRESAIEESRGVAESPIQWELELMSLIPAKEDKRESWRLPEWLKTRYGFK